MCVPLYYFERYAHTYASGVPKMVMTEKNILLSCAVVSVQMVQAVLI